MTKQQVNKDYYRRNRQYILERKRLKRQGKPIPAIRIIIENNVEIQIFNGRKLQKKFYF